MSETEEDNILNSLKNYSSNFSSIPTRKEILSIDTETFLQNGGSKNQIKGVRYLSENEDSDNNSEMYGGKKNKPSPSDQYHQESVNYLKDDLQLSPLEARAYKSLAYRYIKENNSTSTSLEKAKLMLALVKSENFLNEFKNKLDETMKIIESIDSEKEKRLLSEQNNTKSEEEKIKKQKKQKGGSKLRFDVGTEVIYHRRIGIINDITESPGEDTLYRIVFDSGPEVMLHESDIVVANDEKSITDKLQKLQKELVKLESGPGSGSGSGPRSRPGSGPQPPSSSLTDSQFFPGIKIPNNIDRFEIETELGKLFSVDIWSEEYINLNNCRRSDEPNFVLNAFPQIFTPEVNEAFIPEVNKEFYLVHTPAGGSCLIHAFLLGLSRPYQHLRSNLDRQICGDVFRRHVLGTKYLDKFIPTDQRELMLEPAIVPESVRADLTYGTIYVYENLEAGTVPGVLSDILKINVLILSPTGIYQLIDKHNKSPFIVIYGDGAHYSTCYFRPYTFLPREIVLRFTKLIDKRIEEENVVRLVRAKWSGVSSVSSVPSPARVQGVSSAPRAPRAPSPGRLPTGVLPESLAALIGLQAFPLETSLRYPSKGINEFIKSNNGKKVFDLNAWMSLFINENDFPRYPESNIIIDSSKTLNNSKYVQEQFNIVKTINSNNTSLIHAFLFAISKDYKKLILDDDRETCVNVFIEKILKKIYLTEFKTENKYTFLCNVTCINLLLLQNMYTTKFSSWDNRPVMTIYFDGINYNACIVIKDKVFLFPNESLKYF